MDGAPGRILAIDPGTKRIGFALSDPTRQLVRPYEVYVRKSLSADLAYIGSVLASEEVSEILVGLPYRMDGSESPSTERARAFIDALREAWPDLPIATRDETLTTWAAEERLSEEGVPRKAWKSKIDAYAAACLLEEELESRIRTYPEKDR